MTTTVERAVDLPRDDPEAYIARDRRWALSSHLDMPDRVEGSALFADISGFTPLTEALANELGSERGAEELTANLGRVFHAVIDELHRRGGDVIYFSGDAITCWLDGDDGTRATAAGLAMQEAMARVGRIRTPAGTEVQLALKVAVAVGRARRFVVGDPQIQLIDVLAGAMIDDLAEAEHHADKGEVVLETAALAALEGRVTIRALRHDEERQRTFGVVETLDVEVPTHRRRGAAGARRGARDAVDPARGLRAAARRRAASCSPSCGRPTRSSCASAGSTTTTTPRRSTSSTRSSGGPRRSWPATAATSSS